MKCYMIIDRDNPVSIKYSEISKQSYQPLIDDGTIEIIDFPAVNLKTLEQFEHKYRFEKNLTISQYGQEFSATEKAGMCSHFELMKKQAQTSERFFILEHDSYLLEPELFREYINLIEEYNLCYANIGLFCSCYTLSQHFASWSYMIMTKHSFPVNTGPYSNLYRLIKTYLYRNEAPFQEYTYLIPVDSLEYRMSKLYMGKYEFEIEIDKINEITEFWYSNPTTQVISDKLNVTQEHIGYSEKMIKHPHTRHPWFKRID